MKNKLLLCLCVFLLLFLTNCKKHSKNLFIQEKGKSQTSLLYLLQQIDSLGIIGEYDPDILNLYIEKTENFRSNYPEDPFTVEYLYKAGLVAMTLAKNAADVEEKELSCKKAISLFDEIQLIYPEFVGIKNCLLNKGIIYYEILNDYENAEILYREYIARYPADTINAGVDSYLQYLGKSPEDIIGEIEKIKVKK